MPHRIEVPLVPECSACIIHSLGTLIPLLTDDEDERFRLFALAYFRLAAGFQKKTDPATLSIELYRELYDIGELRLLGKLGEPLKSHTCSNVTSASFVLFFSHFYHFHILNFKLFSFQPPNNVSN